MLHLKPPLTDVILHEMTKAGTKMEREWTLLELNVPDSSENQNRNLLGVFKCIDVHESGDRRLDQ
jgi:hypothetical protein